MQSESKWSVIEIRTNTYFEIRISSRRDRYAAYEAQKSTPFFEQQKIENTVFREDDEMCEKSRIWVKKRHETE